MPICITDFLCFKSSQRIGSFGQRVLVGSGHSASLVGHMQLWAYAYGLGTYTVL